MADLNRGQTFGVTEQVTNTKLHNLIDNGTVTSIINADCSASMDLENSKILPITRANWLSGSGMFNLSSIVSTAGTIPQINLPTSFNDLSFNNLIVSSLTSIADGTVSTLKVGTTNQGDVLYDNGTSIARLTPGTDGQFLKTQGAGANPAWDDASANLSNVIFVWNGADLSDAAAKIVTTDTVTVTSGGNDYTFLRVGGTTYTTVLYFKYKHLSSVSSVSIYSRLWSDNAAADREAYCKVDIGGENNEVKSTTTNSPAWSSTTDIDVSGLTPGTVYDGVVQLKNESALNYGFLSQITLIAS